MFYMVKKIWRRIFSQRPEPPTANASPFDVDPRECGLVDAMRSGWYGADGELFTGFQVKPEDTVLDFGCGEGGTTLYLARQGSLVLFADAELEKINSISKRMGDTPARGWQAIHCESEVLPIADACVDKIIVMEVLEHVSDPQRTLKELVRVAAPGARFLITVPDPKAELLQKEIAPRAHFMQPNHVRIFARDEFDTLVQSAGLTIEKKDYAGFYWSLWMCFYWVCQRALNAPTTGATLDKIQPPYHPLLKQWAATWQMFIGMPESTELKSVLDKFLPKSQIIIARKASL